jgi:hypothetical protein
MGERSRARARPWAGAPSRLRVLALIVGIQLASASKKSNEDISLEEKAQSWNLVLVVTLLGVYTFWMYVCM